MIILLISFSFRPVYIILSIIFISCNLLDIYCNPISSIDLYNIFERIKLPLDHMIFKDVCSCFAFNVLISFSTFSIIPNPINPSILWETIDFSFQFFFQFNSVFSILKTCNSFLFSSVPFLPHYFSLSSLNTYVFDTVECFLQ